MLTKEEWNCSSCSYLNKSSSTQRCSMCLSQRPRNLSPKRNGILSSKTTTSSISYHRRTIMENSKERRVVDLIHGSHSSSDDISANVDDVLIAAAAAGNDDVGDEVMIVASTVSARKRKRNHSRITSSNSVNKYMRTNNDDDDEVTLLEQQHNQRRTLPRQKENGSSLFNGTKERNYNSTKAISQIRRGGDIIEIHDSPVPSHGSSRLSSNLNHNHNQHESNQESSYFTTKSNSKVQSTIFGSVAPQSKPPPHAKMNMKMNSHKTPAQTQPRPSKEPKTTKQISEKDYQTLHADAIAKLQTAFSIPTLRNLQPIAIESALRGLSQIIIMATGGGKSLCYQLPALVLPGVTIVVSPLIALMVDQVRQLKRKHIKAEMICSANTVKENQTILERLKGMAGKGASNSKSSRKEKGAGDEQKRSPSGNKLDPITMVYCTPELIQTGRFQSILKMLHQKEMLALIAIDEAHCMSTWGHDFRPSYRKLTWLRVQFPDVPVMACTATATKKVIEDIKNMLKFGKKEKVHMSSFNRPNVCYEVRHKDIMGEQEAMKDLISTIKKHHKIADTQGHPCSGIVYVHKRDDTTMISSLLRKAGIAAAPYHAGLKDAERKQMQLEWTEGKVKVAIATVAFGMGIDLAHVRYVLHWSMSKSLEGFYQESGRAGRDGLPSLSVLYYSREDASKFAFLIRKNGERERQKQTQTSKSAEEGTGMEALNEMMEYCTSRGCRRKFLLKHFGEEIDAKKVCRKTCDYCIDPQKASQAYSTKSSISRAVRDVKQQKFRFQSKRKEDGMGFQKDFYEDDVDDDHLNKVSDSGLGIMHNPTMDAGFSTAAGTKLGIRSSKSILSKYETMECGKGSRNGFVNFKARPMSKLKASFQQEEEGKEDWNSTSLFGTKSTSVTIPSHLLAKVHESSASLKTKETKVKSSNEISTAADRARAELEEIKKKREALLAKFAKK